MSNGTCWVSCFATTIALQIILFPLLLVISWGIDPSGKGPLAEVIGVLYCWGLPVLEALGVIKLSGSESDIMGDIVGVPLPMCIYAVAIASLFTFRRAAVRAA